MKVLMEEISNQNEFPQEILGRQVIGICPECKGEGMLWGFDEKTHWAVSCKKIVTAWATFWTYQRIGNAIPTIVTFHFDFEMKTT